MGVFWGVFSPREFGVSFLLFVTPSLTPAHRFTLFSPSHESARTIGYCWCYAHVDILESPSGDVPLIGVASFLIESFPSQFGSYLLSFTFSFPSTSQHGYSDILLGFLLLLLKLVHGSLCRSLDTTEDIFTALDFSALFQYKGLYKIGKVVNGRRLRSRGVLKNNGGCCPVDHVLV